MRFDQWLDTFIDEKGIDREQVMEVEGAQGANFIPVQCLIDALKQAGAEDQAQVKDAIVRLDFRNAPILPFFRHIAQAIAL